MSKASLETLARTMSIAFLCLAVVAIGREQITSASAVTPTTIVKVSKAKLNNLPLDASTQKKTTKASLVSAPKQIKKRGVWLKELLYEAGFRGYNLREAWAIAMRESRGHPTSHNTNTSTGDNSYGIFQINMIGSLGPDRREVFNIKSNNALFNPLTNAKSAYYMSQGGNDWSSWDIDKSGYNGGVGSKSYRYWLTQYPKG